MTQIATWPNRDSSCPHRTGTFAVPPATLALSPTTRFLINDDIETNPGGGAAKHPRCTRPRRADRRQCRRRHVVHCRTTVGWNCRSCRGSGRCGILRAGRLAKMTRMTSTSALELLEWPIPQPCGSKDDDYLNRWSSKPLVYTFITPRCRPSRLRPGQHPSVWGRLEGSLGGGADHLERPSRSPDDLLNLLRADPEEYGK